MMTKIFRNLSLTAAAVSAASLAIATPAQALTFGGNVDFTQAGTQLTADFSNETLVNSSPNFTIAASPVPSFQNLVLNAVVGPIAANTAIDDFITNIIYNGQLANFDLVGGMDTITTLTLAGGVAVNDFTFSGVLENGGNILANVTGTFSGIETATNNDFSIDLAATPVPTPALLPGLLGMGAAFVRKRRASAEQSA